MRRSHSKASMATVSSSRVGSLSASGPTIRCLSWSRLEGILPRKAVKRDCFPCFDVLPPKTVVACQDSLPDLVCVFLLRALGKSGGLPVFINILKDLQVNQTPCIDARITSPVYFYLHLVPLPVAFESREPSLGEPGLSSRVLSCPRRRAKDLSFHPI